MRIAILDSLLNLASPKQYPKLGTLELDATLTEAVKLDSNVTTAPIETGESVTDHVYNEPLSLSLECSISSAHPKRNGNTVAHVQAYEALKQLRDAREPIDVVTGLDVYPNMVVTGINIQRDASTNQQLRFQADLVQVVLLDSESINADGETKHGRKQGTPLSQSELATLHPQQTNIKQVYA